MSLPAAAAAKHTAVASAHQKPVLNAYVAVSNMFQGM
jgi:hypothetical protein